MRYAPFKHALDRALAVVALLVLAPVLLALAVLIRLDSSGPVIFRQRRIGQGGRGFTIYKLRTMHVDAPAYSLKVSDDDPRVTRLGKVLRRTALDELPQLWNIVRGEMSWVGPRPEQPHLLERYAERHRARFAVRPGLTGWWQVRRDGIRQIYEDAELDLYYVEHMSPLLDLKIVLLTPLALLGKTGRPAVTPEPARAGPEREQDDARCAGQVVAGVRLERFPHPTVGEVRKV